MTTIALPDRWTFDGEDLSTYARLVRQVNGGEDLAELRGDDSLVPSLPGRRWAPKVDDARRFALALHVTPMDAAGGLTEATEQRQAQRNLDDLRKLFGKRGLRPLVHHLPDGSTRTAQAEVASFASIDWKAARHTADAIVDFSLPDPYFYGPNVVDVARALPGPGSLDFAFTHPGTASGHKVLFSFHDAVALVNPRVTNLDSGIYVECLVSVPAATLDIDCEAFTAFNGAVQAGGSLRHSGSALWMVLAPGVNNLRVSALTLDDGFLTTTFKPPYHGA